MRIPQTPERIKEAPAQALRAVFAGVGQVLLMTERIRRRAIGQEHSTAVSAGALATRPPDTAKPSPSVTKPSPSTTKASTAKASTAKASTAKASTVRASAPKAGTPKVSPADPAPPEARGTGVLPVPHYSELSVASLRARLRGLDVTQVRDLLSYERAHEERANVIAMFERRIAKLEAEGADPAAG